jgi:DNA-directed RNA polymerase subunit RPC12/RpoP
MSLIMSLSYVECSECKNYFFIEDIGGDLNNPAYCPYCGVKFEYEMEF